MLVSAPAAGVGDPSYGVQWDPGTATRVVLGADETAFPAVAGILATLDSDTTATLLLEAADPADTLPFVATDDPRLEVHHVRRAGRPGGVPLLEAGRAWAERYGAGAAAAGPAFYGWFATESVQVAELRRSLLAVGIGADRVHTQGYWIDREGRARD
nr:SIP domain-containing protein [Nocardioides zeae]